MAATVKVRFLKSPTGKFALAYFAGEVGEVPASIAVELQKQGYAEPIAPVYGEDEPQGKIETATAKPQTRKAVKKRR